MDFLDDLARRQGYCAELVKRKRSGEVLDFARITRDELAQLWVYDALPDSVIAELYDVDKKVVTKKRFEFGLKQGEALMNLTVAAVSKELAATAEAPEEKLPAKVMCLICEIETLTLPELEALSRGLSKARVPVFREMEETYRFLKTFEKVVPA